MTVRLAAENASFSGNVVGDVEYDKSEYFVYMSHGSKRMTIKLEGYLPLEVNFEDYEIKSLKGKTVYVMIVSRDILPIHFYAGIGFNAVSLMGPSAHLGIRYKIFSLEGGFVYGMDKVDNVSLTLQGSSSLSEAYDYSCSKAWAGTLTMSNSE